MSNVETFRPRSGFVMAFSAFFAISAFTYINILDYGLMGGLPSIGWGLVLSTIFYLIFIHPKVIFFDEGLTIVNPLTTITLGWHDVVEIDARFTMYVIHRESGTKIHAFAAQAPGRYHSRTVHPNEVKGMRVGDSGMIRAGESPEPVLELPQQLLELDWNNSNVSILKAASSSPVNSTRVQQLSGQPSSQ